MLTDTSTENKKIVFVFMLLSPHFLFMVAGPRYPRMPDSYQYTVLFVSQRLFTDFKLNCFKNTSLSSLAVRGFVIHGTFGETRTKNEYHAKRFRMFI